MRSPVFFVSVVGVGISEGDGEGFVVGFLLLGPEHCEIVAEFTGEGQGQIHVHFVLHVLTLAEGCGFLKPFISVVVSQELSLLVAGSSPLLATVLHGTGLAVPSGDGRFVADAVACEPLAIVLSLRLAHGLTLSGREKFLKSLFSHSSGR
jgi:hypothetical protein